MMINYIIPGLQTHNNINFKLINLMKKRPEMFYPNINIFAVYGNFPYCIFDGGRSNFQENHYQWNINDIEKIINKYNELGIIVRLVYTNSQITEQDFTNRFGNICLELCNKNPINQIVINNEKFLYYIKNKYSNLSFVSSTTKCLSKKEIDKEIKDNLYDQICVNYNLNTNLEYLKNFPKDKCELLVNEACVPGCPYRKEHYQLLSLCNLSFGKRFVLPECPAPIKNTLSYSVRNYPTYISYERIKDIYEPMGIQYYKLDGRDIPGINVILLYGSYMVLPEYRDEYVSMMMDDVKLI